ETASLKTWLEKGGVLVYADDRLDPQLAVALDLHKTQVPASTDARAATPALVGVAMVTTNSFGPQFAATADQAVLLRGVVGRESVIEEKVGQGRVIALATPELLCNGWLQVADNAILAADLESISAGPVLFDEFHHSFAGHDPAARGDWTRGPLGLGLVWGTLAVFLALLLRGRAFGPRLALGPEGPRSTAEYAVAVGHLLRLARGRQLALQLMAEATRRRLAARVGIGGEPTTTRLLEALERRAPNLGREFAAAQADAAGVPKSETALLRIARRLHDLAYPHAGKASTPGR
ncbi:MAG: hypothetical protein M3Z13_07305, partial [Candidatus Dormibacteraeota bacterium]|nr:hypothetical protein [Candidatus Dormibacteraeota bacterium]